MIIHGPRAIYAHMASGPLWNVLVAYGARAERAQPLKLQVGEFEDGPRHGCGLCAQTEQVVDGFGQLSIPKSPSLTFEIGMMVALMSLDWLNEEGATPQKISKSSAAVG